MKFPRWLRPWLLIGWIALLSFFFAQVEIQIEGPAGWAGNLPTWRVENIGCSTCFGVAGV